MAHTVDVFGRQAEDIRSMFGDLRIVEAPADVLLYVTAAEHERGKRGDPNKCMFSRACKRALGARGVLFYPSVAYIDMPDPNHRGRGEPERVIVRFLLPARTRRALQEFDQSTDGYWEGVFLLKAVSPGMTRAAKVRQERARKAKRAAEAELEPDDVELEQRARRTAKARKAMATRLEHSLVGIRSGHGRIRTPGVD